MWRANSRQFSRKFNQLHDAAPSSAPASLLPCSRRLPKEAVSRRWAGKHAPRGDPAAEGVFFWHSCTPGGVPYLLPRSVWVWRVRTPLASRPGWGEARWRRFANLSTRCSKQPAEPMLDGSRAGRGDPAAERVIFLAFLHSRRRSLTAPPVGLGWARSHSDRIASQLGGGDGAQ